MFKERRPMRRKLSQRLARDVALTIASGEIGFPPSVALATLVEECQRRSSKRKLSGSFYTDYRLARILVRGLERVSDPILLDPACGSGLLLAAAALQIAPSDLLRRSDFIANGLFGIDIDANAIRGARLVLASMVNSISAVMSASKHLLLQDSLAENAWSDATYTHVICNPPWERLALTQYDVLRSRGVDVIYGAPIPSFHSETHAAKQERRLYAKMLREKTIAPDLRQIDLSACFLELAISGLRLGRTLRYLMPGSLIRAASFGRLREKLFSDSESVEISIFDNRAKFFEADSRLKFCIVSAKGKGAGGVRQSISIDHGFVQNDVVRRTKSLVFDQRDVARIRPDLTIPEIRSREEWTIFASASRHMAFGNSQVWNPRFFRELDMTMDRELFHRRDAKTTVPLVEGRHITHYRHDTKAFVSGSGRSAVWKVLSAEKPCAIRPQYFVDRGDATDRVGSRLDRWRVGFCDIGGQTNERTFVSALIPPGAACGNKVPTMDFADDLDGFVSAAFLGISNSFIFDWLVRRVVSTSINFFILRSLPMPAVERTSSVWRQLVGAVHRLGVCHHAHNNAARPSALGAAVLRRHVDFAAAELYGITAGQLDLILRDFPLLDRSQPPLPGERGSTVTRDYLLSQAYTRPSSTRKWKLYYDRYERAAAIGAIPYVTSQLAL